MPPASANRIAAIVLDIDGVVTDGRVAIDGAGTETKSFFLRDLDAITAARANGIKIAVITGETGALAEAIPARLGAEVVLTGAKDKLAALTEVAGRLDLPLTALAYVGDADRDAPALERAGLGFAPGDASLAAKNAADKVLASPGGRGAVTEALEEILRSEAPEVSKSPEITGVPKYTEVISRAIKDSIAVKEAALTSMTGDVSTASSWIADCLRAGRKVLTFGNGGSAADAQHFAGELVGRFYLERRAWPVIALSTDTSILTALGNDFGYETVFERQVEAHCKPGDILVGLSTSGNSPSVVRAVERGRAMGARTISLTGDHGGRLAEVSDLSLKVPSSSTPRIQECHITLIHAICEAVEADLAESASAAQ